MECKQFLIATLEMCNARHFLWLWAALAVVTMTLFSLLVLIFLLSKELTLSAAVEVFVGKQNFSTSLRPTDLSEESAAIVTSGTSRDDDLQGYRRVRRMLQQLKFNKDKMRIIEKAFFYAFRKCHLSDVTELVPLEAEARNEQKKCIVEKLEKLENFPGEYTQYLRNDTDINESEVLLERLNMEKDNSLNIENDNNLSNLNGPVREARIKSNTPYGSNPSNMLKTSLAKIKNVPKAKHGGGEKPTKKMQSEVGDPAIKQISDLPNFPSITLGGDGNDTQQGLILYINFTVSQDGGFSIVDSPAQLGQVLKSIPETLNYVIGHINKRREKTNVA
ncbi:uncharacterized protein LOC100678347 [Nasonia vitripennis]|uniref:Uncharacterized protein n=1 Tax=Nasonia vitripennis TaxID=7425 RepID=A0A7M7GMW1_NASVI|nr:uncharacterized protein LOC100678347 [Nasonia vitripennis]